MSRNRLYQADVYRQDAAEAVFAWEDHIWAKNKSDALNRFRQLAGGGYIYDSDIVDVTQYYTKTGEPL
jgi:hypothetical protein